MRPNTRETPSKQTQILELNVGDSIQLGNQILTVVDIEGDDVSFRIEGPEVFSPHQNQTLAGARPR